MAFTAMVGKELLELDYASDQPGKTILSTYVPTNCDETASETAASVDSLGCGNDEDSFKDAISEEEKEGVAEMKTVRPAMTSMLGDEPDSVPSVIAPKMAEKEKKKKQSHTVTSGGNEDDTGYQTPEEDTTTSRTGSGEPRRRFRDSLSTLQIEEAKATGRAQLGLAFEMLTMMKKRALKADPEAYQCLIDACGRVGDTKRATDLLPKMHEDGIVADGTVYACLVSASSAEAAAWRKGTKEEDLPGKRMLCYPCPCSYWVLSHNLDSFRQ
jgi:pentatricopeptide repeat protein